MSFRDLLGKELLFFDGGMGTMLQAAGLAPGEIPEYWNMEHPEAVCDIHYQYYMAGANIVETNTFGANSVKMPQDKYTSHDVMVKAVGLAKEAAEKCKKETGRDKLFVAASMGPTGKLMQPMGDLTFDAAYEGFKELAIAAEEAGADLALIETMTDLYEIKAAILGVKENTNLPVVVSGLAHVIPVLVRGCFRMTCNASGIDVVRFLQLMGNPRVLCEVPVCHGYILFPVQLL